MASLYMVTYKKLLNDLPVAIPAVNTLLGIIGVWSVLLLWPGLVIYFYCFVLLFYSYFLILKGCFNFFGV